MRRIFLSMPLVTVTGNPLAHCPHCGESIVKLARSAIFPLLLSAFFAATPASAAPLLFDFTGQSITGPVTATFQLDSNPVPDQINDQSAFGYGQVFFDNVAGVFNGQASTASSISFGTGIASQFQISGSPSGFAQFGGDEVFTGPFSNPVFSPGTYTFTGFGRGTLTVSSIAASVPEAATWTTMVIGFGAIGFAMRRRSSARKTASIA
jgi:hypothetical protein